MRSVRILLALCLLVSSGLATTTFLEPGGDADFGINLWTSDSGIAAVATDFVHGKHVKSIKYRPGNQDRIASPAGTLSDAGGRFSFWIYIVTLPNATATIGFTCQAGSTGIMGIKIKSTGVIFLDGGTPSADGPTLTTGVWYHFTFAQTVASTTVNEFRLYKDGVLGVSVTNATLGAATTSRMKFGNSDINATLDFRSSDHYFDNSNALTDVGSIWVTAKRPVSNGTAVEFTTQIGAGGSGYGSGHSPQVNERPVSTTNGWSISTTTIKTEEYSIEDKTVGDMNIGTAKIIDYMGWMESSVDSTANSPVHHIIVGGTATARTMTTSAAFYIAIKGSATYPAGNTDIGMDGAFTTTPHLSSLFDCGIIVAFIPATTTPARSYVF